MATVTISLPDSLEQFAETQLLAKGFDSISDYFSSLLREAQAKEDDGRLENLLLEGLASGEGVPADKEFWTELRADAARLAQECQAGETPM